VRARHSFLEICKTPELAAEVSIHPFRVLGVDAIIVFSDILIVAEAMGMPLDVPDSGPVLSNPVHGMDAVRRLHDFDPARETRFLGDAIRVICKEMGPHVPVLGFAAAPWTLACYMIEGQTRGDVSTAKRTLGEEPAVLRELLARISCVTTKYLQAQIEAGGPVTVTHPDMVRYFMTIREACDLVVTAASHALGMAQATTSVYVLNMGQPIKIVDLAERMIRLSGLEPGRDVDIVFTGIRPGERLNEILFAREEPTSDIGIEGVVAAAPVCPSVDVVEGWLAKLKRDLEGGERAAIYGVLRQVVPNFAGEMEPAQ